MSAAEHVFAVYGLPPHGLIDVPSGALQVSPLFPGAASLETCAEHSLSGAVMVAPSGSLERRYQLALALRALKPGAVLDVLGLKDRGGARLRLELERFGCRVEESSKRHHRICRTQRPDALSGVAQALSDGAPRLLEVLSLWSQPGVFSWDRIDPGSALLSETLPLLSGRGADLGCGLGYLTRGVLRSSKVLRVHMVDIDRRAVEAARRNVEDPRTELCWADVTASDESSSKPSSEAGEMKDLDFVVMNPPFHKEGSENRNLGLLFIRRAAQLLRRGGGLWLVANRHLPYEAELASSFAQVELKAARNGYKVFAARR